MKRSEMLYPMIVHQLVSEHDRVFTVPQMVALLQWEISEFVVTPAAVREAMKKLPKLCWKYDAKIGYVMQARSYASFEEVREAAGELLMRFEALDGIPFFIEGRLPALCYDLVMPTHKVWSAMQKASHYYQVRGEHMRFSFESHWYGWFIRIYGGR